MCEKMNELNQEKLDAVNGGKGSRNGSAWYFIDKYACIGCGTCLGICPTESIHEVEESGCFTIEADSCIGCGVCADCCPSGCIYGC